MRRGFILPMIVSIIIVFFIIVPVIVDWISQDTKSTIREQRKSIALNIAIAAVERGYWKVKSSTVTFNRVMQGNSLSGYSFDRVYTDIGGGSYRILITSGSAQREVVIIGEGRDSSTNEVRAIKAVYQNQTIPGAIISKGIITWANAFTAHWGPILSHNNINITDANAAKSYYPRKFSRQFVTSVPSYPRDTNGLAPPNEGFDWRSDAQDYVPELPDPDFESLKASASINVPVYLSYDSEDYTYKYYTWKYHQTPPSDWISSTTINTLNVNACSKKTNYSGPKWWQRANKRKTTGAITYTDLSSCNLGGNNHNNLFHFQNSYRHPLARLNRVWYWESNYTPLVFTGSTGANGSGIIGTIIVRGDLTNYWGDNLDYTKIGVNNCKIPSLAYQEYKYIQAKSGNPSRPSDFYMDTAAINEYPGDNGYQVNRSTFYFGAESWTVAQPTPSQANTDVGFVGFLFVDGNFRIERAMDYYGALWIKGNVSRAAGVPEMSIIFFKDDIDIPTLNVVLVKRSWQEITPSKVPWP